MELLGVMLYSYTASLRCEHMDVFASEQWVPEKEGF